MGSFQAKFHPIFHEDGLLSFTEPAQLASWYNGFFLTFLCNGVNPHISTITWGWPSFFYFACPVSVNIIFNISSSICIKVKTFFWVTVKCLRILYTAPCVLREGYSWTDWLNWWKNYYLVWFPIGFWYLRLFMFTSMPSSLDSSFWFESIGVLASLLLIWHKID